MARPRRLSPTVCAFHLGFGLDITFNIRAIAPDLVSVGDDEPIPETRSQERRWTQEIRKRLPVWVEDHAVPAILQNLAKSGVSVQLRTEGDNVFVAYEPLFPDYGFVRPEVMAEFGARSTGEPHSKEPLP